MLTSRSKSMPPSDLPPRVPPPVDDEPIGLVEVPPPPLVHQRRPTPILVDEIKPVPRMRCTEIALALALSFLILLLGAWAAYLVLDAQKQASGCQAHLEALEASLEQQAASYTRVWEDRNALQLEVNRLHEVGHSITLLTRQIVNTTQPQLAIAS